jgi:hypothetical protein
MKFKVTAEHLYWWPIKVRLPNPDPKRAGTFVEQEFKMQFAGLPLDEAKAIENEIKQLPAEEREEREHEHIIRVARDWNEDVVGEDDQPIPFNVETLRELLQSVWVRKAIYVGWAQSQTGEEARRKN